MPSWSSWRSPSQTLRDEPAGCGASSSSPTRSLVSLMKGIELGTMTPDERGHRRGRPGSPPSGWPSCPAPTSPARSPSAQPAATTVACADEDSARRLQDACTTDVLPPVLLDHRRRRCRDRRLGEERDRAGQRHGRRAGVRGQRAGLADHARAGRDVAAGRGAGRQPDDVPRPGGHGRPDRHLLLAAVAQPHLRREPRQGPDRRRDHRGDQADLRGREVLPVDPRLWRSRTASRCRSPSRSSRSCTTGCRRAEMLGALMSRETKPEMARPTEPAASAGSDG